MYSNQKLALDLLIFVFMTFILSTNILSVSTTSWNINTNYNRTGLFQQCLSTCCCQTKELNRATTLFVLFAILLLSISTLSSVLLMIATNGNRYYMFVPLTLFGAGISMTLAFTRVYELMPLNGYSAYIFLIDIVLSYVLGGITILHGSLFYV